MRARPIFRILSLLCCLTATTVAKGYGENCRDGKDAPPRLLIVLNLWGLQKYPSPAQEWSEARKVREIAAAGFDAFDVWVGGAAEADLVRWKALAHEHGLGIGVEFEVQKTEDAEAGIVAAKRLGSVYLDAHVGSYFTPEAEAVALLRALDERARRAGIGLAIQTHRGRVTQDLLRSVALARAIPELRFDLDLSHYLVAGSHSGDHPPELQEAFAVLMDRAIMLDGRISTGEQVQVDMENPAYRAHTERITALWKQVMKSWLRTARRGDVFPFRIELGPPPYAIVDRDGREISDRWTEQKAMKTLAERIWNEAVAETGVGQRHERGQVLN